MKAAKENMTGRKTKKLLVSFIAVLALVLGCVGCKKETPREAVDKAFEKTFSASSPLENLLGISEIQKAIADKSPYSSGATLTLQNVSGETFGEYASLLSGIGFSVDSAINVAKEQLKSVIGISYGMTTVNYNRDIEIFPVLNAVFEEIYGSNPYKSPTDMGVNMAGNCILDDEACCQASKMEIIRRYYKALNKLAKGDDTENEVYKIELLMKQARITTDDRAVTVAAKRRAEQLGVPTAAIELADGTVITSKTTDLQIGRASCRERV